MPCSSESDTLRPAAPTAFPAFEGPPSGTLPAGDSGDFGSAWRIRRAQRYLERAHAERLSLDEVAAEAQLSKYHFHREFRRLTGRTPFRYLTEVRIARACELLREGMSCGDVAHAVGFYDQSHFTRSFRELVGETPGRWRRREEPQPWPWPDPEAADA